MARTNAMKNLTAVSVLANAEVLPRGSHANYRDGESRESTNRGGRAYSDSKLDSRGGSQKPLRTPKFQAFLDSLEPQPWKRKKLQVNWATCHFNPK